MFDVAPQELLVLGTVALLVIPPKDLPRAMRVAGYWVGRARGVARQFRSGFDNMVREAELEEMEKKWRAENERIMREHPALPTLADEPATTPQPEIVGPEVADDARRPVSVEHPAVEPGGLGERAPAETDGKAPS